MRRGSGHPDRWITGIVLLSVLGCAAGSRQMLRSGRVAGEQPRVAMLPLEDLSGQVEASDGFTRMVFAELVQSGTCRVTDSGAVLETMDSLSIRDGNSLTRDQLRTLAERLGVDFVLTGTLLESTTMKTGDGEVPVVGAALKLIEVATARVVWAEERFLTGEDRETVFGWGRQRSLKVLTGTLARDMMRDFVVSHGDSTSARRGRAK